MSYLDVFKKKLTVFADETTMLKVKECGMVKCPGVIGWKANARPPGWKVRENAPLLPGGGGWALLELTDALYRNKIIQLNGSFSHQASLNKR